MWSRQKSPGVNFCKPHNHWRLMAPILVCFILHDDHYQTLQLTIITCYETKECVRRKQLELKSINCKAPNIVDQGFNGEMWFLQWEKNQQS